MEFCNASAEAATTAACEAAATVAKAATEADSFMAWLPSGQRPEPANWGSMTVKYWHPSGTAVAQESAS